VEIEPRYSLAQQALLCFAAWLTETLSVFSFAVKLETLAIFKIHSLTSSLCPDGLTTRIVNPDKQQSVKSPRAEINHRRAGAGARLRQNWVSRGANHPPMSEPIPNGQKCEAHVSALAAQGAPSRECIRKYRVLNVSPSATHHVTYTAITLE